MRIDWCVSSWFRIKNTHSLTFCFVASKTLAELNIQTGQPPPRLVQAASPPRRDKTALLPTGPLSLAPVRDPSAESGGVTPHLIAWLNEQLVHADMRRGGQRVQHCGGDVGDVEHGVALSRNLLADAHAHLLRRLRRRRQCSVDRCAALLWRCRIITAASLSVFATMRFVPTSPG